MELTHTFTVPASVEETWAAFNDLEGIAPCFPGATLSGVDGDEFTGSVKVRLGPIALQYSGTGRFVERDESAHRVVIEARGKDKRGNGTAGAHVTARLHAHDEGTRVEVTTDLNVTGKPAQFGRGVMQDVSDTLLSRFVACIAQQLSPPADSTEAEPVPEPVPEPEPEPEPATATTGTTPPPLRSAPPAEELDLGATVLPVLARRYGPGVLVAVVLLLLLRRRRR